jgi:hypothetical protein
VRLTRRLGPGSFGARSEGELLGSEAKLQMLAELLDPASDAAMGLGCEDPPPRAGRGDPVVLWRNVAKRRYAIRSMRAIGAHNYPEARPKVARLNSGTR